MYEFYMSVDQHLSCTKAETSPTVPTAMCVHAHCLWLGEHDLMAVRSPLIDKRLTPFYAGW